MQSDRFMLKFFNPLIDIGSSLNAFNKDLDKSPKKQWKIFFKKWYNKLSSVLDLEITLTSNKIENIVDVTKFLQNRKKYLNETTVKFKSQEAGFLAIAFSPVKRIVTATGPEPTTT